MSAEWASEGLRIAVIGLAATGLATARILSERGSVVTLYDSKPEAKLDPARVAEAKQLPGVTLALGVAAPDWNATDLVVPSPGVPKSAPPIAGALARGIPVWSEIEVAYRLAKAPILAITGTNGKTTTTALVGAICREAGLPTWVAGNIAEDEGKRTPLIVAAVECPADGVIVAEISSFQLEHVHTFKPKVAAWLNLSVDHLDRYGSMDEYAAAKARIFAAQDETDSAVLNADDEYVIRYGKNSGKPLFRSTFSLRKVTDDWDGTNAFRAPINMLFQEGGGVHDWYLFSDTDPFLRQSEVPLIGLHNIANVLAAMLIWEGFCSYRYRQGNLLKVSTYETAIRAIKAFPGVAHRMEFVAEINSVRYINNSMCTNPAAVQASVSAIETPLIAISGGIHKGGDLSPMYESLRRYARKVILIGASKTEIADGLRAAGMDAGDVSFADTMGEAVTRAAELARAGDTVMLVPGCASFDMFSGFEERGAVFRASVRSLRPPLSPSEKLRFSEGDRGEAKQ